jgi:hypothetical protein
MNAQPTSAITYASPRIPTPPAEGLDVLGLVAKPEHVVASVSDLRDSHFLMLDHQA